MSVFFSIIIPTYNRAAFLDKAIESVLIQTFTNLELIVVDDGSTDDTKEVVEKYMHQDNRIKYRYQKNAERCAARNNGVSVAEGEYVCFLDSDDYFLAERLSLLHNAILEMHTPTALLYTDILKDGEGKLETHSYPDHKYKNVFDLLLDRTIHSQQICCATFILKEFRYDTRFIIGEDKELWLRIATMYPVIYIPFQATVVLVEHDQRTVGANKPSGYEKQIETYNFIKKEHKRNFSSKWIINTGIHDSYMGLARSYANTGKTQEMLYTLLKACSYSVFRSFKQKVFLVTSNFIFFKPTLFFYRLLKFKKGKVMSKSKNSLLKILNWSTQSVERRNFYQKQARDLEWNYIKPEIKAGKFLDVGCGKGYITYKAYKELGCESYGVDPDNNLVGVVFDPEIDLSKITLVKGFAESCPFGNNFFDVLFCSHVIEHLENTKSALEEMKRITSQDGKIIIGVPTNYMAFVNLISAYLFTTHTKVLGWFFYKKWKIKRPSLKQIFVPPSHSHEGRSVFFDLFYYRDRNWTTLLEKHLVIEKRVYPALYPYPDFIQFFPTTHFNHISSTVFYVCTKLKN